MKIYTHTDSGAAVQKRTAAAGCNSHYNSRSHSRQTVIPARQRNANNTVERYWRASGVTGRGGHGLAVRDLTDWRRRSLYYYIIIPIGYIGGVHARTATFGVHGENGPVHAHNFTRSHTYKLAMAEVISRRE